MKKKASKRREQILKATFQAVVDKGFDSVTLQDISDYAGVSKGVTNYYFENKKDVFYNLMEWTVDKIHLNERNAIDNVSTAMEKLEAYVNAAFQSPEKNKKFYRVYLEFLAQAVHNKKYLEVNDKFYQNCWSIGREIVKLGQAENIFSDMDIDLAAVTIRAIIDGNLVQWLMRDDDSLHDYYRMACLEAITKVLTK